MAIRRLCVVLALSTLALGQNRQSSDPKGPDAGYVPATGFVPDATTAVKIAEAVLVPIYGQGQIDSEHPLRAVLKNDIWTIETTSPCEAARGANPGSICYGGGAVVKLSKTDARILFVTHYK